MKAYSQLINTGRARRYSSFLTPFICKRMKKGSDYFLSLAAKEMAWQVHSNDLLIPVPGHTGKPTHTKILVEKLVEMTGCGAFYMIQGNSRTSYYDYKKRGGKLEIYDTGFFLPDPGLLAHFRNKYKGNVWIVDNVIDTGLTMDSMMKLAPGAKPLVFAVDDRH